MSDDERARVTTPPRLAVIITATLLGGMIAAVAVVGSAAVEAPLTTAAREALRDAGVTGVSVRFDGREALLSSDGDPEADLSTAVRVVSTLDGVRWATVESPRDDAPRAILSVEESADGAITVTGTVGTAAEASAVQDAARAAFGPGATASLTVRDGVAVPTWSTSVSALFTALAQVDGVRFTLDPSGARVGGTASDPARVTGLLDAALGDIPLTAALERSGPTAEQAAAIDGTVIRFAADSVTLDGAARAEVARLADALRPFPEIGVALTGHVAIPVGTEADAIAFSLRRAQSVADALIADGIDASRIDIVGAGSSQPVGDNATAAGAAANRRVTVLIEGDG
jgi:outer membrane protein OmpA-like peptidoglycan-associated protein